MNEKQRKEERPTYCFVNEEGGSETCAMKGKEEEEEGGGSSRARKDGENREDGESIYTAGESECSPPSETVD